MANEFIARNGLRAQNTSDITGSLIVTAGVTGSFTGSLTGIASTASFVNPLVQGVTITGSLMVSGGITTLDSLYLRRNPAYGGTTQVLYMNSLDNLQIDKRVSFSQPSYWSSGQGIQVINANVDFNGSTISNVYEIRMTANSTLKLVPDLNYALPENSQSLYIRPNSTLGSTKSLLKINDSTEVSTYFRVGANGNTQIGTATDANYKLRVIGSSSLGDVYVTGSLLVSGSSVVTGSLNINGATTIASNTLTLTSGSLTITTGSVIMPNRPAFRVYGSGVINGLSTTTNGDGTLNNNNFTLDWQQGTAFTASSGIFTAPIAGLYGVHLNCRNDGNINYSQLAVIKNNSTVGSDMIVMIEFGGNSTMNHTGGSSIAKLAVGDTLRMKVLANTITFDGNDNWAVAYMG